MAERLIQIISDNAMDKPLADWAAVRLKVYGLPSIDAWGACRCAGVFRSEKLVAVCVYHGYQPYYGQIQMSLIAETPLWCNRGVLVALLDYPFRIGLHRIWVITRTDNKPIMRLLKWIGFVREGGMKAFFGPAINAYSWRLLTDDYEQFLQRIGREDVRRRQGQNRETPRYGTAAAGAERL